MHITEVSVQEERDYWSFSLSSLTPPDMHWDKKEKEKNLFSLMFSLWLLQTVFMYTNSGAL